MIMSLTFVLWQAHVPYTHNQYLSLHFIALQKGTLYAEVGDKSMVVGKSTDGKSFQVSVWQ